MKSLGIVVAVIGGLILLIGLDFDGGKAQTAMTIGAFVGMIGVGLIAYAIREQGKEKKKERNPPKCH